MSLILRYLYSILKALCSSTLQPLDQGVIQLRVWPFDLDPNLHLNNGRFLSLMDLGRMDLVVRCGLGKQLWKHGWRPLVGSAVIRYKGSLEPFQTFELKSRIVGWDDKWFFIEQRFVRQGRTVAVGAIKGLFRGRNGNVPSAEVLAATGVEAASPELPRWLATWHQADGQLEL